MEQYRIEICRNLQLIEEFTRDAHNRQEIHDWVFEWVSTHNIFKNWQLQIRITPSKQIDKIYYNHE
jgi:hypothetical protein